MEERHTMSNKEIDRLMVIRDVVEGKKSWKEGSEELDLCMRQVGYLCQKVREQGNKGIIHGLKGKQSNNQLAEGLIEKAIGIIEERYEDFGPTFANEQLIERHGLAISTPTIRKAMIKKGIWKGRISKAKHRAWRERRPNIGMLEQLDGSIHDWFEERGPRCVLILYIDDATSKLMYGKFVDSESTDNLLRTTKEYLLSHGRPLALYVDKDSIYVTNRETTIEEDLRAQRAITQFSRAMCELGIEVITANSPQAKGRVERSFGTHQDRLVKELRLGEISTIAAGNRFLNEVYIPKHNGRFACMPAKSQDRHRPLLASHNLDIILSIKTERVLGNDWTVRFRNDLYQVTAEQPANIRPKERIMVEIRLDGTIHLCAKGQYLAYKKIKARRYRPHYERILDNKYYAPKQGSLSYARQVQISL